MNNNRAAVSDETSRVPRGVPSGGQFAASARSEADLNLPPLSAAPEEQAPFNAVGDCPDCGEPMIGHVGGGRFVPGASCEHCHHTVMTYEWEITPTEYDAETYLYELQDDALIRVTDEGGDTVDLFAPDDETWAKHVSSLGMDPDAFTRAHLAATNRHSFVEAETERGGYAHMADVYSILLDRERVPEHVIVARATNPESLAEDDEAIENAIDRLYRPEDRSENEDFYEVDDATWARIEAACDEAGLGVMKDIYESMANREILHRDQVKDAEAVTGDYENVVGPAIDRIEDALIDEHGEVEH